jgi:hypothetical protein
VVRLTDEVVCRKGAMAGRHMHSEAQRQLVSFMFGGRVVDGNGNGDGDGATPALWSTCCRVDGGRLTLSAWALTNYCKRSSAAWGRGSRLVALAGRLTQAS